MTPPAESAAVGRVNEHLGVSRTHADEPLLVLEDLKTHFKTDRGLVRAVDGVSLSMKRGESLGVVGESGSGKTDPQPVDHGTAPVDRGHVGSVRFAGQEILGLPDKQMRHLWGAEMSMVFQNPLNSLNPLMKIGKQIMEPLSSTSTWIARTPGPPPPNSSATSASRRPNGDSTSTRTSCPAACASAS